MKRHLPVAAAALAALGASAGIVIAASGSSPAAAEPIAGETARSTAKPLRFADSALFIEVNGTDGDAGLQSEIDADAWKKVIVLDPSGRPLLDFGGEGRMAGWGLTGLTFESSEPGFDEVALAKFRARFPEGKYLFRGRTIDDEQIVGAARLTHVLPRRPTVVSPAKNDVVPADGLTVQWEPVTLPRGVRIVDYQVIVAGETIEEVSLFFDPSMTSAPIPPGILKPGNKYTVEVLAREKSGNRTITEVPFRTS